MIATFRDTEIKYSELRSELEFLKKQVRLLQNKKTEVIETEEVKAIDSELTSGGNIVTHQLFHIFKHIKTDILDIVNLTIDSLWARIVTITEMLNVDRILARIINFKNPADPNNAASTWNFEDLSGSVASNRTLFLKSPFGTFFICHINTGNTAKILEVPNTVLLGPGEIGSPSNRWGALYAGGIDLTGGITSPAYQANEAGIWPGLTSVGQGLVRDIGITQMTIQYKDWAGVNQSANVLTGATIYRGTLTFRLGLHVGST